MNGTKEPQMYELEMCIQGYVVMTTSSQTHTHTHTRTHTTHAPDTLRKLALLLKSVIFF